MCSFATLAIATMLLTPSAESAPPSATLEPAQRYVALDRPITVIVGDSHSGATTSLVLMQGDGTIIAGPIAVTPGSVELGRALPGIWSQRMACYVQLLIDETPVGSALVVEPMLSRLPPRTEQAVRPDGVTKYSRIIGWGKVIEKAPEPIVTIEQVEKAGNEEGKGAGTAGTSASGESPPSEAPAIEPRVFSGFRLYLEEDVILHTTEGEVRVAMSPENAPNTVWNFRQLVADGFYDGLTFHRVVPFRADGTRFVIQGGDPNGDGEGGPGWWVTNEPSDLKFDFGVIGMARDDHPDSAGSQFFFSLSREGTQHLDGQYCSFGYAVDGAATIRSIAELELADIAKGRPVQPPLITRAELAPAPARAPGQGRPDQRIEDDISSPPPPETAAEDPAPKHPGRVPR